MDAQAGPLGLAGDIRECRDMASRLADGEAEEDWKAQIEKELEALKARVHVLEMQRAQQRHPWQEAEMADAPVSNDDEGSLRLRGENVTLQLDFVCHDDAGGSGDDTTSPMPSPPACPALAAQAASPETAASVAVQEEEEPRTSRYVDPTNVDPSDPSALAAQREKAERRERRREWQRRREERRRARDPYDAAAAELSAKLAEPIRERLRLGQPRRSGRVRFLPLEFWRGEHKIYRNGWNGDVELIVASSP